ncbi:hypothetical protein S245_052160, partial [Arachis hypogaea]
RFIRVTIPEETWQIVLWWWRNYGGRHWILLLLKGAQFHSLMWRNKNLLCQGGQGQEQEQLRQTFQNSFGFMILFSSCVARMVKRIF